MILPGLGTLLQIEGATPGTFETIGQRVSLTPNPLVNGEKDDTNLDDTFKRFSSTIIDLGQLKCKVQYDPAMPTHQTLLTMVMAGSAIIKAWKLIFNDSATEATRSSDAFDGWVVSFEEGEAAEDNNIEADVTIRLVSIPERTPRTGV